MFRIRGRHTNFGRKDVDYLLQDLCNAWCEVTDSIVPI